MNVEEWGDHPTFRVRKKNFVFSNADATSLSFKLSKEEAAAVVATEQRHPAGYGLGRHGWVAYDLEPNASADRWEEVTEWVETSYTLVAPKTLARQVHPDTPLSFGELSSASPTCSEVSPSSVIGISHGMIQPR